MVKILIYATLCLILASCVTGNDLEKIGKHGNKKPKHCDHFEDLWKQGVQKFYACSIQTTHGFEFSFCRDCSGNFASMFYNYELLKTTVDYRPGHNNVSCISEIVNVDRMDFWVRIHDEAVKLWEDAHCYKCYDWNSTLINGTTPVNQTWSQDFQTFKNLTTHLKVCESNHSTSPCTECMENYTELNQFYEAIKKKYQTNLCFDIENSMNRTRRYWSGNLGCCRDDEASFLVFTIMASIIGALPILFYFSAYFMTKRAEDHSPVTDGMTPNVPSINSHEPMPGTSSASSSNASTAIVDDSPTLLINNNTKPSPFKNTKVTNIVKASNIVTNPNNLLLRSEQPTTMTPPAASASQNLIDLERSPAPAGGSDQNVRKLI